MKKAACIVLASVVLLLAHSAPGQAHFRGGIWVGPVWGPGWWGPPYPYPYAYGYPYAAPPTVVIQQQPQQYIEQPAQQSEQQYWYFCPDPQGYYPYVKACPKGWMRVVPTTAPPETKE
jgi:hypothetical protein